MLAGLMVAVFLMGCGSGGPSRPKLYVVTGELFVKGQPASGARVILHPIANPDPSEWPTGFPRAIVGADGRFVAETFDPSDGAPAGKYKVRSYWLSGEEGQEEDPNAKPRVNQIDPKYNDVATTPWEIEVKPEENQLPRFDVQ